MSLYNMLFGMNGQADLILAVIGLRKHDVERFRDVFVEADGAEIHVYSRTGGGNRESYPNTTMRSLSGWVCSYDDNFDSTYCTDVFKVPVEFVQDVRNLSDILSNGLRPEFGQHLIKTLRREATEADTNHAAYEAEQEALRRTKHSMANGHTFVPHDDSAMKVALKLAEANGGELRSCWGILPLVLVVRQNYQPYPKAKSEAWLTRRVDIDTEWKIDADYWQHCQEVFTQDYPQSMAKIRVVVQRYLEKV